tara:strand:- start:61 stop:243 length:183 start_codon:yes stop_codon:yes gene_type:complete
MAIINPFDEYNTEDAAGKGTKKKRKVAMADAPVWPMEKWPHPTPGQGPLPNTKLPKKGKA